MAKYDVVQILDLIDIIGEDTLKEILSDFSCPLNYEIEGFLKAKCETDDMKITINTAGLSKRKQLAAK